MKKLTDEFVKEIIMQSKRDDDDICGCYTSFITSSFIKLLIFGYFSSLSTKYAIISVDNYGVILTEISGFNFNLISQIHLTFNEIEKLKIKNGLFGLKVMKAKIFGKNYKFSIPGKMIGFNNAVFRESFINKLKSKMNIV